MGWKTIASVVIAAASFWMIPTAALLAQESPGRFAGAPAELSQLVVAADFFEDATAEAAQEVEFFARQRVVSHGSSAVLLSGVRRLILSSKLVKLLWWVDPQGRVFKGYPSLPGLSGLEPLGPEVRDLVAGCRRAQAAACSGAVILPDGSPGFWMAVPVFTGGAYLGSVLAGFGLDGIIPALAASPVREIYVLDEFGSVVALGRGRRSAVGSLDEIAGGGAFQSIGSLVLKQIRSREPGVIGLGQGQEAKRDSGAQRRLLVAPFQVLGSHWAICGVLPAQSALPTGLSAWHVNLIGLVLAIVAAIICLCGLVLASRKLARVSDSEQRRRRISRVIDLISKTLGAFPTPAALVDASGKVLKRNRALVALAENCAEGSSIYDLLQAASHSRLEAFLNELFSKGAANACISLPAGSGEKVDILVEGSTLHSSQEPIGLLVFTNCVEDKQAASAPKTVSEKIAGSEAYLQAILDGFNEAVMVLGPDYRIKRANRLLVEMARGGLGEDVVGRFCYEVIYGRDAPCEGEGTACPVSKLMEQGRAMGVVQQRTAQDGSELFLEVFASPVTGEDGQQILVTIRDITEKTQLSRQLARADRLKAFGEMASGVAHDFNNLLGVILGRTQLLLRMIDPKQADTKRNLEIIEQAAIDGAETVRRIQEFTKVGDTSSFVPVDLNEIIVDSIEVTRPRWKDQMQKKGVSVSTEVHKGETPLVAGNPSELREVFVNLINNAIDAMPNGGRIRFETGVEGGYAYATVSDTGEGIPSGVVERIFDPFFTTRGGQNSGLGLSIVYGIIQRHGGTITVDSKEGQGCTFKILIPALVEEAEAAQRPVSKPQATPTSAKARVLIIDDEEDIRNLLVDILTGAGHKVDVAATGAEGLTKCRSNSYDFVITDLGMPNMSGWEAARRIKEVQPGAKVVLSTGWGVRLDEEKLRAAGISRIISKPFQVDEVLSCIDLGS